MRSAKPHTSMMPQRHRVSARDSLNSERVSRQKNQCDFTNRQQRKALSSTSLKSAFRDGVLKRTTQKRIKTCLGRGGGGSRRTCPSSRRTRQETDRSISSLKIKLRLLALHPQTRSSNHTTQEASSENSSVCQHTYMAPASGMPLRGGPFKA